MNLRDNVKENRAIQVFLVIIIVVLIMALYGYLSGAWE